MMSKEQLMARAVATRDVLEEILNPPTITLPAKKIKKPKEWTVMETGGCALNGSYVRYAMGQKLTDPIEVAMLLEVGLKIEATA